MTREDYIAAYKTPGADAFDRLAEKRTLLEQLEREYYAMKAQSQSISAGGGSKSVTSIALAAAWSRIGNLRREIKADEAALGLGRAPGALGVVYLGEVE